MNFDARQWFDRYPYDAWARGYAEGYNGDSPTLSSTDPEWPTFARGYGEGTEAAEVDHLDDLCHRFDSTHRR